MTLLCNRKRVPMPRYHDCQYVAARNGFEFVAPA